MGNYCFPVLPKGHHWGGATRVPSDSSRCEFIAVPLFLWQLLASLQQNRPPVPLSAAIATIAWLLALTMLWVANNIEAIHPEP